MGEDELENGLSQEVSRGDGKDDNLVSIQVFGDVLYVNKLSSGPLSSSILQSGDFNLQGV